MYIHILALASERILIDFVNLGYYFHQLVLIGFHSDAFEQLGPSYGAEDRGRILPEVKKIFTFKQG